MRAPASVTVLFYIGNHRGDVNICIQGGEQNNDLTAGCCAEADVLERVSLRTFVDEDEVADMVLYLCAP